MKRVFLLAWTLLVFPPLFAQEDYMKLSNEINEWQITELKQKKIKHNKFPQVIECSEHGYSIVGYFKNGVLQDSTRVVISDLGKGLRLSGVVMEDMCVKGEKEEADGGLTYGIFKVSNFQDGSVISNKRKAGDLKISDVDVQYYKGNYNDCPAILSMKHKCIVVDGKTGRRGYVGLRCSIKEENINLVGYKNLKELLLTASADCRLEFDNGWQFIGKVSPVLTDTGYINFKPLEGEDINTPDGFAKVSVKRDEGFISMCMLYKPGGNVVSEEMIVPSSFISDENLWNKKMYYQNASEIRYKFTDNSSYKGKFDIKIVDSDDGNSFSTTVTTTNGVYTFGNSDIFTGNLSGRYYGGVPIDGTMLFADGTQTSGNWLLKYDLTKEQLDSLKLKKYPTEIRKQAEEYHFSNHYIKYEARDISVFSPDKEEAVSFSSSGWFYQYSYLRYDKETKRFVGIDKYEGEEWIEFEFIVDDYGRRIEEIVYEDKMPKYRNKLTWYSNGEVQSIKSYHYATNEIYLVINFFSDGSFKNAYKYEKGNNGNLILRKSKEAHPTFGGFSIKQYDLDGNYEKMTEWSIGDYDLYYTRSLKHATLKYITFKQIK